jgi:hypothetical protein
MPRTFLLSLWSRTYSGICNCDANVVQWKETTSAGRERKTGAHPRFFVETDRECRGGFAVETFETASVRVRGGDPKKNGPPAVLPEGHG